MINWSLDLPVQKVCFRAPLILPNPGYSLATDLEDGSGVGLPVLLVAAAEDRPEA